MMCLWTVVDKKRFSHEVVSSMAEAIQLLFPPLFFLSEIYENEGEKGFSFDTKIFILLFIMPTYFGIFLHRSWKVSVTNWILTYLMIRVFCIYFDKEEMTKLDIDYFFWLPFYTLQMSQMEY